MIFSTYRATAPPRRCIVILVVSLVAQYAVGSLYSWVGVITALLALIGTTTTMPFAGPAFLGRTLGINWSWSIGLTTSLVLLVFSILELTNAGQWCRSPRVVASGFQAVVGFGAAAAVGRRFVDQRFVTIVSKNSCDNLLAVIEAIDCKQVDKLESCPNG